MGRVIEIYICIHIFYIQLFSSYFGKIMSRSPEMFAARIALLAASTVFLVNACTNGTPQWDEATWDMFRVFGRLLEVAT